MRPRRMRSDTVIFSPAGQDARQGGCVARGYTGGGAVRVVWRVAGGRRGPGERVCQVVSRHAAALPHAAQQAAAPPPLELRHYVPTGSLAGWIMQTESTAASLARGKPAAAVKQ